MRLGRNQAINIFHNSEPTLYYTVMTYDPINNSSVMPSFTIDYNAAGSVFPRCVSCFTGTSNNAPTPQGCACNGCAQFYFGVACDTFIRHL